MGVPKVVEGRAERSAEFVPGQSVLELLEVLGPVDVPMVAALAEEAPWDELLLSRRMSWCYRRTNAVMRR